jgi:hypothetical protein
MPLCAGMCNAGSAVPRFKGPVRRSVSTKSSRSCAQTFREIGVCVRLRHEKCPSVHLTEYPSVLRSQLHCINAPTVPASVSGGTWLPVRSGCSNGCHLLDHPIKAEFLRCAKGRRTKWNRGVAPLGKKRDLTTYCRKGERAVSAAKPTREQ